MTNLDARLAGYHSPVLSAFRIIFGLLYTIHGSQKLFGWPVAAPGPIAVGDFPLWWAGLIEFVLGILITVGFFTRIAAFIASGEMAFAYFYQHWPPLKVAAVRRRASGRSPTAASWRSCSASRSCCSRRRVRARCRSTRGGAAGYGRTAGAPPRRVDRVADDRVATLRRGDGLDCSAASGGRQSLRCSDVDGVLRERELRESACLIHQVNVFAVG